MNQQQTKLFSFLLGNMKDMEKELRAQSIVLDALVNKVISIDDLGDCLNWARNSPEMLDMINKKYSFLRPEAEGRSDSEAAQPVLTIH